MQPEEKLSVDPQDKKMAVTWGELKRGNYSNILKINRHFRTPAGAVTNRTE